MWGGDFTAFARPFCVCQGADADKNQKADLHLTQAGCYDILYSAFALPVSAFGLGACAVFASLHKLCFFC
jgi:hypothetical protein